VISLDGVSRLILSSPLLPGAFGGGVFWNGSHIAVNWQTGRILSEDSEVLEEFSTAALNSNRVVAIPIPLRQVDFFASGVIGITIGWAHLMKP